MSTTIAVPVTIAPEARTFTDKVGQREEFDLMIDRAKHVVPALSWSITSIPVQSQRSLT